MLGSDEHPAYSADYGKRNSKYGDYDDASDEVGSKHDGDDPEYADRYQPFCGPISIHALAGGPVYEPRYARTKQYDQQHAWYGEREGN